MRVLFYAERLAIIESLIALVLVGAMILGADQRWRRRVGVAPLPILVIVIWAVFAVSELFRS